LSLLTAELTERGHEVEIASFDAPDSTDFHRFDGRIVRHRLAIGEVARNSAPVELLARVPALRRLIRGRKPDVCIGFMHSTFVPLSFAAIGTRIPIIASEHTAFDHYRQRALQSRLLQSATRRFSAITIPSERVRSGYPAVVADRMTVIPNPLPKVGTGRREAKDKRKRLLAVGNLREEKGHLVLLDAFSRIAKDHPDWELRLVGEGPLKATLEQAIRSNGLSGRAEIAEVVSDIATEYAAADLFAMPSAYESFGLATAEALASGLPAVGFADCPGTNEIIRDGLNGLLVQGPDRAEALAAGLSRLMGEPALLAELSSRAPETVADYEAEGIIMRWEEVLQSVASNADARK
jgi:glycosyltransferase involved in cell wall biosynthesis